MKRIRGNNVVLALALALAAVSGFSSRVFAEDAKGNPITVKAPVAVKAPTAPIVAPVSVTGDGSATTEPAATDPVTDAEMADLYGDLSDVSDQTDANTKSVAELQRELVATQVQMGQLRKDLDAQNALLQQEIVAQKAEMDAERAQFTAELAAVKASEDPDKEAALIAADLKKLDGTAATSSAVAPVGSHVVVGLPGKLPGKITPIAIHPTTAPVTTAVRTTPIPVRPETGITTVLNNMNGGGTAPAPSGVGSKANGLGSATPIAVRPTTPVSTTPVTTPVSTTPVPVTPVSTTPTSPIATTATPTTPVPTTPVPTVAPPKVTPVTTAPTTTAAASKPNWFEQLLISMLDGISHGLQGWAQDLGGPAPVTLATTTPTVPVTPVATNPITIHPITLPAGLQPIVVSHVTPTIVSAKAIDTSLGAKYPLPIQRSVIRSGVVGTIKTGWTPTTATTTATTLPPVVLSHPVSAAAATNTALGGD